MKYHSIEEYIDAGCPEINDLIGMSLHVATGGKICTTGCARYWDGKCEFYMKLTENDNPLKVSPGAVPKDYETVRQEAKRRDISIKQVRRERNPNR